jgi:hypothetical protein
VIICEQNSATSHFSNLYLALRQIGDNQALSGDNMVCRVYTTRMPHRRAKLSGKHWQN